MKFNTTRETEMQADEYYEGEHEAEMYAENAWLRAAENAIPQAELDYEAEREANDPFLAFLEARREADLEAIRHEEGRWEEEEFYAWKDSLSA